MNGNICYICMVQMITIMERKVLIVDDEAR